MKKSSQSILGGLSFVVGLLAISPCTSFADIRAEALGAGGEGQVAPKSPVLVEDVVGDQVICPPNLTCGDDEKSLRLGLTRLQHGDLRGALLELDSAVQKNPRNVEALFQLGNVQFRLGDRSAAIQNYNRALEINPDRYEVLVARGHVRMKAGDAKGADNDFQKARAIEEQNERRLNRRR